MVAVILRLTSRGVACSIQHSARKAICYALASSAYFMLKFTATPTAKIAAGYIVRELTLVQCAHIASLRT